MTDETQSTTGQNSQLPMIGPESLAQHMTGDRDEAMDGLSEALKSAKASARVIFDTHAAVMADVTHTSQGNAKRSRDAALKVAAGVAAKLDKAREKAKQVVADLESRTSQPPPPKDQSEVAVMQAILARLGSMSEADRKAATQRVGDVATMRAILSAPTWLTGVLESELPLIRTSYRMRHHPAEFARISRLKASISAMERDANTFLSFVDRLTDREAVKLAEASEQRAAAALAAMGALS